MFTVLQVIRKISKVVAVINGKYRCEMSQDISKHLLDKLRKNIASLHLFFCHLNMLGRALCEQETSVVTTDHSYHTNYKHQALPHQGKPHRTVN